MFSLRNIKQIYLSYILVFTVLSIPVLLAQDVASIDDCKLMEKEGKVVFERYNWIYAKKNPLQYKKLGLGMVSSTQELKALYSFKNIEEINISNNWKDFSFDITAFPNLKKLEFSNCSNKFIDTILKKAIKLNIKELFIYDSRNLELPQSLFDLKSLVDLKIYHCTFRNIPRKLSNLSNLKNLVLNLNHFEGIDSLSFLGLENLEGLEISFSPILLEISYEKFINEVLNCKNLSRIEFKSIGLKRFPYELGSLKNLKELTIHEPNLTDLMDIDVGLDNLNSLNIGVTNITVIPSRYLKIPNILFKDYELYLRRQKK